MKKTLLFLALIVSVFTSQLAKAQSFNVAGDTIVTGNLVGNTEDAIINITTGNITLQWIVTATDFPSDWLSGTGICDNKLCYSDALIWTGTSGISHTSNPYSPDSGDFHLQLNIPASASAGTHYMTVSLKDFSTSETKTETFIVNKWPTAVPVVTNDDDINIYPNPAREELNVVYSNTADVKNIAVYNIIGKVMNVYRVSGNSANLNLRNVPAGIYFVRLLNANGGVVATRKFTRQ